MRTEARRGGLHRNVNESPRVPASAWGLRGTSPAELEPTGHSAAAAWSSAPRPDGSPRGAAHSRPVPAQPQREQRASPSARRRPVRVCTPHAAAWAHGDACGRRVRVYTTVRSSFPTGNAWHSVWITDEGETNACPGKAHGGRGSHSLPSPLRRGSGAGSRGRGAPRAGRGAPPSGPAGPC